MYSNSGNYDYRQQMEVINDIAKAINGEYSAISCYNEIAKMAPSEKIRNQILEIRKDEIRHFQGFSQLYMSITGRQPTPKISEECPKSYRKGLSFAFRDEQETVDFYLDIADKTNDPNIRRLFKRAAKDEQNHAVWFLYFMHQLEKGKKREASNLYYPY